MIIDREVCKEYLERYGEQYTQIVAMEEASELVHAIAHILRGGPEGFAKVNLAQAIADVLIVIEELKIIHGIPEEEIDDMTADIQTRTRQKMSEER